MTPAERPFTEVDGLAIEWLSAQGCNVKNISLSDLQRLREKYGLTSQFLAICKARRVVGNNKSLRSFRG